MERTVAIKTLGRLLGKNLGYRVNAKAPTQEEREAARAALPQAVEERNKLTEQRDARRKAILAADVEYQNILAAVTVASKNVDKLSSTMHQHKITVGVSTGMFFLVKAEGDTWEEIIGKLTAEKKKVA